MTEKVKAMSKIMDKMTPEHMFNIGPVPIDSTVVNQWIAMIVLFGLVFWLTRGLAAKPKTKKQAFLELMIQFFYGLLEPNLGKKGRKYLPLVGSLFLFILTMNLLWFIPGIIPPTTDLSTTFGLAITTIITIHVIGIFSNGIKGYLHHYAQPFLALAPLNVVEEAVKPVSLSLRLFGNMFGEKVAVTILFILVPLFIPIPVMMLGVLMGVVQAFVFTLLTVTYLTTSVKGH
ncbi:MAG: F0F1 ATP synthase subunit A [Bacillota bacterium]